MCRSLCLVFTLSVVTPYVLGQGVESNEAPTFDELPQAIQEEILRLRGKGPADSGTARDEDVSAPTSAVAAPILSEPFIPVAIVKADGSVEVIEY